MSITVRLFSDTELARIKSGADKFLATIFMNKTTFSEKEIKFYPYHLRKTFIIDFANEDQAFEPSKIYATDINNLKKFLKKEYHYNMIVSIQQVFTRYKDIPV